MDLEFRKYLTNYGITKEEFESMTETEKIELKNKFDLEVRTAKSQSTGESIERAGNTLQELGKLIGCLPFFIIFMAIMYFVIFK